MFDHSVRAHIKRPVDSSKKLTGHSRCPVVLDS
jgi:hypothetical protein